MVIMAIKQAYGDLCRGVGNEPFLNQESERMSGKLG